MYILLSEHFCHIKENPIIAFSFINSLIINHKSKFSKFQMVELYELNQKYIYFILAKEKCNKDVEIIENKNDVLIKDQRAEYFLHYFNSIKISIKVKSTINNYIDNILQILVYRKIFGESLSFKLDDNNEYINSVKIDFFDDNTFVENNLNEINKNNKNKKMNRNRYSSKLYYIIHLLNNEQLYHNNIINFIKIMNLFNDIPAFMIFKYYLFYDIFEGGEIPQEISNKLYSSIVINKTIDNNKITRKIYSLLKLRYNEQNNKNDSKFFSIYEYKRELRIKYFNEECAQRLGFKQKDIINEKIDVLMPKEFCKSHQNIIKKLFIGDQLQYYYLKKSYLFDKTSTVLYPVIPRGKLIYHLSKNLTILSENVFKLESEYNFMLNHNFNILAISNNFEEDYLLNQKIFQLYNLNLLEILQIKSDKIYQKFENDFKLITFFQIYNFIYFIYF